MIKLMAFIFSLLVGTALSKTSVPDVIFGDANELSMLQLRSIDKQGRQDSRQVPLQIDNLVWQDLGEGCCEGGRDFSDGKLWAGTVPTLADCQAKCREFQDCGAIEYGWQAANTQWCFVWSERQSCSALDAGVASCGAGGGNNGVHAYKITQKVQDIEEPALDNHAKEPGALMEIDDCDTACQAAKNKTLEAEAQKKAMRQAWKEMAGHASCGTDCQKAVEKAFKEKEKQAAVLEKKWDAVFEFFGTGCCSGSRDEKHGKLWAGPVPSLDDCKFECGRFKNCSVIEYGWSAPNQHWCFIWDNSQECASVETGDGKCGVEGDNRLVRAYKRTGNVTEKTAKQERPAKTEKAVHEGNGTDVRHWKAKPNWSDLDEAGKKALKEKLLKNLPKDVLRAVVHSEQAEEDVLRAVAHSEKAQEDVLRAVVHEEAQVQASQEDPSSAPPQKMILDVIGEMGNVSFQEHASPTSQLAPTAQQASTPIGTLHFVSSTAHFEDSMAGCCSGVRDELHGKLWAGSMLTLEACQAKCQQFSNCGAVEYGWAAPTEKWCFIWDKSQACAAVEVGFGKCGGGGDNLHVRAYKVKSAENEDSSEPKMQDTESNTSTADEATVTSQEETTPSSASSFQDLGVGCCGGDRSADRGRLWAGESPTLDTCKEKCREFSNCGVVEYGWAAPTEHWCFIWDQRQTCTSLETGFGKCGGGGDNRGVRAHKLASADNKDNQLSTREGSQDDKLQDTSLTKSSQQDNATASMNSAFEDVGTAGCCSGQRDEAHGKLWAGPMSTLDACKQKCNEFGNLCGTVEYGWGYPNKHWCFIWDQSQTCSSLESGAGHCGEGDHNEGVRAYRNRLVGSFPPEQSSQETAPSHQPQETAPLQSSEQKEQPSVSSQDIEKAAAEKAAADKAAAEKAAAEKAAAEKAAAEKAAAEKAAAEKAAAEKAAAEKTAAEEAAAEKAAAEKAAAQKAADEKAAAEKAAADKAPSEKSDNSTATAQSQKKEMSVRPDFTDIGSGCCSGGREEGGGKLWAGQESSLDACMAKCRTFDFCGVIEYGWSASNDEWCFVWDRRQTCTLEPCRGDSGVHAYRYTSTVAVPSSKLPFKDEDADKRPHKGAPQARKLQNATLQDEKKNATSQDNARVQDKKKNATSQELRPEDAVLQDLRQAEEKAKDAARREDKSLENIAKNEIRELQQVAKEIGIEDANLQESEMEEAAKAKEMAEANAKAQAIAVAEQAAKNEELAAAGDKDLKERLEKQEKEGNERIIRQKKRVKEEKIEREVSERMYQEEKEEENLRVNPFAKEPKKEPEENLDGQAPGEDKPAKAPAKVEEEVEEEPPAAIEERKHMLWDVETDAPLEAPGPEGAPGKADSSSKEEHAPDSPEAQKELMKQIEHQAEKAEKAEARKEKRAAALHDKSAADVAEHLHKTLFGNGDAAETEERRAGENEMKMVAGAAVAVRKIDDLDKLASKAAVEAIDMDNMAEEKTKEAYLAAELAAKMVAGKRKGIDKMSAKEALQSEKRVTEASIAAEKKVMREALDAAAVARAESEKIATQQKAMANQSKAQSLAADLDQAFMKLAHQEELAAEAARQAQEQHLDALRDAQQTILAAKTKVQSEQQHASDMDEQVEERLDSVAAAKEKAQSIVGEIAALKLQQNKKAAETLADPTAELQRILAQHMADVLNAQQPLAIKQNIATDEQNVGEAAVMKESANNGMQGWAQQLAAEKAAAEEAVMAEKAKAKEAVEAEKAKSKEAVAAEKAKSEKALAETRQLEKVSEKVAHETQVAVHAAHERAIAAKEAAEQASLENMAIKQAAAEKVVAEKEAAEKALKAEKVAGKRAVAFEKAATEQAVIAQKEAVDKANAERALAEKAVAEQRAAVEAADKKVAAAKAAASKNILEQKAAAKQAIAEKKAAEDAAAERIEVAKAEAEEAAAKKVEAAKAAAAKEVEAERAAAEKANAEKKAVQEAAAEKVEAAKVVANKVIAAEKATAEKKAAEQIAYEKEAAKKRIAAERAAATEAMEEAAKKSAAEKKAAKNAAADKVQVDYDALRDKIAQSRLTAKQTRAELDNMAKELEETTKKEKEAEAQAQKAEAEAQKWKAEAKEAEKRAAHHEQGTDPAEAKHAVLKEDKHLLKAANNTSGNKDKSLAYSRVSVGKRCHNVRPQAILDIGYTLEFCESFCTGQPDCSLFSFDKISGLCTLHSSCGDLTDAPVGHQMAGPTEWVTYQKVYVKTEVLQAREKAQAQLVKPSGAMLLEKASRPQWQMVGSLCCRGTQEEQQGAMWAGPVYNREQCEQLCHEFGNCGAIEYGCNVDGSDWCFIWDVAMMAASARDSDNCEEESGAQPNLFRYTLFAMD